MVLTCVIRDGPRRRRRRMGRRVRVVFVRVRQATVNGAEVLRRRTARIALPRRPLVAVTATRAHQVAVVLLQQTPHAQQVPNTHQVGPEFLHHGFGLRTRVKVKLPAKDSREDVELLMRDVVGGGGWR